jgi:hypothetical protein
MVAVRVVRHDAPAKLYTTLLPVKLTVCHRRTYLRTPVRV